VNSTNRALCNTLQCTAGHCSTLQHTRIESRMQNSTQNDTCEFYEFSTMPEQHTATHCNTLQHTATHAIHCNTLQHTATHCITLHHTRREQHVNLIEHYIRATHCNTLQHIATHCNTLQHTRIEQHVNHMDRVLY